MDAQFAAIVADAARQYADSSGISLESFMSPPMKSVEQLKRQVDLQNDQFKNFRAKRHSIFKALTLAFKPVEIAGEMAAGPASDAFPPSQNIFSAVLYLIGAAHNVSTMYDTIEELFDHVRVRENDPIPLPPLALEVLTLLHTGFHLPLGYLHTGPIV